MSHVARSAAVALALALAPFGGGAALADERPDSYGPAKLYGRLRTEARYEVARLEGARDEVDLDFYQWLTAGTNGLGLEGLDTRFVGRWSKDLDGAGGSARSGEEVFVDARDRLNERRELFHVYTAYARLRDAGGAPVDVTLGRQSVQEVEWAHFDGASVTARRLGDAVSAGAFVGRRAFLYEELERKAIAGGHVTWHALETVDLVVSDVYYVENTLGLTGRWSPGGALEGLFAAATLRWIDEDLDRAEAALDWISTDLGLEASLEYAREFGGADDDFGFDYTAADGEVERLRIRPLERSHRVAARAYKRIVRPFGVYAAIERLEVDRRRDEDAWQNASFWQPSAGADLSGWPIAGLYVEARLTYADFHRPAPPPGVLFDEPLRGEGERDWFEVFAQVRQRIGRAALVGFEYAYREFDWRSKFTRLRRLDAESFRIYAKLDAGELIAAVRGLSLRVDYWIEEDVPFLDAEDLDRAEGLWAAVEYSF